MTPAPAKPKMGRPNERGETVAYRARFSVESYEWLRAEAKRRGMSIALVLEDLIAKAAGR